MSGRHLLLVSSALAAALASALAAVAAPTASELQPIAESAQLKLSASVSATELTLRVLPAKSGAPLVVTELAVSFDGVPAPVTQQPDGSWHVPLPPASGGRLDVFVLHDGLREVLSASLPAPGASRASGPGPSGPAVIPGAAGGGAAGTGAGATAAVRHNYKQLAWWVLNIAVVLIAVIAISRRMS